MMLGRALRLRLACRAEAERRRVGTVSQGSPEGFRGNRWADGFESRWDFPVSAGIFAGFL
jgi:hypothetical protein